MVEKVQGEVVGVGKSTQQQVETLNAVVETSATIKKSHGLKKLFKGFFVEDLKTVRSNIWKDVIVPSVKTGIANAITGGVYMWLFGKNGTNNGVGNYIRPFWSSGTTAYNNLYRYPGGSVTSPGVSTGPKVSVGNDPSFGKYTSMDVYDPEYIRYGSWQDAENVFMNLCERIGLYHVATVKNLYDLSGIQGYEMVLQNWGWYDMPWHKVLPMNDGTFILKLPQPSPLGKS